jgi:hypothetical protein
MATIQKRLNSKGEASFHVRVRLRGHPVQTCTFQRLTDAREWGKQTETAIREGRYFKTAEAKKHTVAELIDRYLKTIEQRNPQRYNSVKAMLFWWHDQIGSYLLSDVTRALLIEKREILVQGNVINKKLKRSTHSKQRTPSTANRYMVALSTAFSMAVNEWEWIHDHPMQRIAKLSEPRGRVRFLDAINQPRNTLSLCHSRYSLLGKKRNGSLRDFLLKRVNICSTGKPFAEVSRPLNMTA